jgi:hypothetical protein
VHGIAEIRENLLRTAAARFVFIRISGFAAYQFAVFKCHAPTANPFVPVPDVDMVKLSHAASLLVVPPMYTIGDIDPVFKTA